MKVTRTYKLRLYPNKIKADTIRYCQFRYVQYINMWLGRLYFNGNAHISTKGLGKLTNDAQYRAKAIIKSHTKMIKATNAKSNIPIFKAAICPAKIEFNKNSSYNFWVKISNLLTRNKVIRVPALSYSKLNKKLKDGWTLSENCEVVKEKKRYFVRVFLSKKIPKAVPRLNALGCDVGYKYSVCRSDGYIGANLSKINKKQRIKYAEQKRQNHNTKLPKSVVKQLLDREARLAVERCRRTKRSLIVENPKVVGQLGKQKLSGWSAAYFANRCQSIAEELEVFVWDVNPSLTSLTCSACCHIDKRSRDKRYFSCIACGYSDHADINAAKNIALKGTSSMVKNLKLYDQEASVYKGIHLDNMAEAIKEKNLYEELVEKLK